MQRANSREEMPEQGRESLPRTVWAVSGGGPGIDLGRDERERDVVARGACRWTDTSGSHKDLWKLICLYWYSTSTSACSHHLYIPFSES